MNNFNPETFLYFGSRGSVNFITNIPHCTLEASIDARTPNVLDIETVQTDVEHRRKGLATTAMLHTVEIAQSVSKGQIDFVEVGVINPVQVPLLEKAFNGSVEWFTEQEDLARRQNQVDGLFARILCAIRQEQFNDLNDKNLEFPVGFDSGVYGLVYLR